MWTSSRVPVLLAAAAAGCSVLVACGVPRTAAAPNADDQGFVDSAARCVAPDTAVAFGSTAESRVAICKTPAGRYEYHGVRIRDGASLVAPASLSGGVVFVAEHGGITYTVAPNSLVISSAGQLIRREPMLDFQQPGKPVLPTGTPATTPTTTSATTTPATTPTTTTPTSLPPPLPAEVGGSR